MEETGLGDISKMKVAELKKHLKLKGLAVTGNKNELIERLQEAFDSGDGPGLDTSAGLDDEEFDEEEILGDEEVDDLTKITPQEEAAVLGNDSIQMKDTSLIEEQSETKKISLKRSEPCLSTPTEISSSTEDTKMDADSVDNKENSLTEEISEPKHKVIKLSDTDITTPEERAKKFGTEASESDPKSARAARFGTKSANAKPGKLSMETGGTDLDKLKKRAERFGEVTSKSLTKVEGLEKLKARENRFGKPTTTTVKDTDTKNAETKNTETKNAETKNAETKNVETESSPPVPKTASEEKAAARAIKFGDDKTNGTNTNATDAKAKRAQRFSVK